MNLSSSRTTSLQAYNMLLYRTAIHPEFFPIADRTRLSHNGYEFESWIFRGGHVFRFQWDGCVCTEVVTDSFERLPGKGLITALPCAGEKDHDAEVNDKIIFMTSMQTETLSDHLYNSTYLELLEHGRLNEGLMTMWTDEANRHNLSMIDMQRYSDQIHVQAYHCRSDCSLVLRTQSIFQVKQA
jgi:hypothetical protein